jgi:hypothetical protein
VAVLLISLCLTLDWVGGGGGAMTVFMIENMKVAFVDLGYNVLLSDLINSHET